MTRRLAPVAALLGVLLAFLLPPAVATAAPAPGSAPSAPDAQHPVVVVGVDGLRWDQVGPQTPLLAGLAASNPTAVLAGRGADEATSTLDAWATLSAGNRARARDLPPPTPTSDPGVAVAQRQTAPTRTGARVGALADALGPRCVTAVGGRGATLAAADGSGHLAPPGSACPLVLVSAATVAEGEAQTARWANSAALLLVVGLGDTETPNHLHVALQVDRQASRPSPGPMRSGSTRRTDYVQTIDIAPTVLQRFHVPPPTSMVGQPWVYADARPIGGAYLRADRRARFMPTAVVGVIVPLVVGFVLLLGLGALLARSGRRELGWSVALWAGRLAAVTPVATFLARLVSYESWGLAGLWALVLALDVLILLVCRGRVARVAVVTAVVLALDVLTGASLQLHSVLGYSALVAGRFAGLGNPAFGVFAAAVLLSAMLAAGSLGGPGISPHPRRRLVAVALIALAAVVVDGAPMFGSDVGGVLALVPAFVVLGLAAAGRRVRVRTLLLAGIAAVAVLVLFAGVDLLRAPDSRTHLGRFAADLLAGRAGETLSRKATANLALLTRNAATLLVLPVLAALAVVLARAERWRATAPLGRALHREPGLRAGLAATLVAGLLGFAVNDSGVVVPAVMMLLVVSATVEVAARHREPGASGTGGVPSPPVRTADVP